MLKKITEIHKGDVFLYYGQTYVLFDLIIRETSSSTCYDRDYKVIPLTTIAKYENIEIAPNELEKLTCIILVNRNEVPMVEVCNEAPFKFEPINLIKVGRKTKVESIYWV